MTTKRQTLLIALALLSLAGLPGSALQAATADKSEIDQQLLQQKLSLMQRMLENSSSSRNIANGDDVLAKQRLALARDHATVAQQALTTGQLSTAAENIEQSMQRYSAAAATVASATDKGSAQHTRFNELSVSIESFRLYVQKAVVQSQQPSPLDQRQLSSTMQLAAQLGQHQNYGEANEVLNEAYMLTITAVSALKGGTTIVYSNTLDTPEQQYQYEVERYKGLLQLFEMVIPDGKVPTRYTWSRKALAECDISYRKAQDLAATQDFPQALQQINKATNDLTRVLRRLGLPIS